MNHSPTPRILLSACLAFSASLHAGVTQVIDFETGDKSQVYSEEQGPTASVEITQEHVRAGSYALKSVMNNKDKRAEVTNKYNRGAIGGENWYGWSVYFPADFPTDGRFDIISQFHDFHKGKPSWGEDGKAPTCIIHRDGRLQLDLKYQPAPQSTERHSFALGNFTPGAWHDFVVHVSWTHEADGFFKLWLNGELMVDYEGPTYMDYPKQKGPYFKIGNYKGAGNWPGTAPRVLYFDEFRMGDAEASFEEVNPAAVGEAE